MRRILIFLALLLTPVAAHAQVSLDGLSPDTLYEVVLTDGSTIFGHVTPGAGDSITVITTAGLTLSIARAQVRTIRPARATVVDGKVYRDDPGQTRLFFTATGRTLRQGEGYAGTFMVLLPFVGYGITDRFTIAGGAPILFGEIRPFWVAPKVQVVRRDNTKISVGTIAFAWDQDDVAGIAYGVGTFGDASAAATLGVGMGYAGTDFSSEPVAMVGGELRVGDGVKLITENYFLPGEEGFIGSFGARFFGHKLSAEVGVAAANAGCCAPVDGVSWFFGK